VAVRVREFDTSLSSPEAGSLAWLDRDCPVLSDLASCQEEFGLLGVGEKFPRFCLAANVGAEADLAFRTITNEDYPGDWKVYFFWPKDFTKL
jgi:AhpC/TSA family